MGTLLQLVFQVLRIVFLFVPFFTNVLLGDRTLKEVIKANRLFTVMALLVFFLSLLLIVTSQTLGAVIHENRQLKAREEELSNANERRKSDNESLAQRIERCIGDDYDAQRAFDVLDGR